MIAKRPLTRELIPIAAYLRMSDDRQENSIERQKSQIIPHADSHGYEIVAWYMDEGIPGDEILKRREFQRMLRDAQAGRFGGILCDDKDRFGRFDSIDLGEVVAPLRRKGIWLETVAQGRIEWNTFAGRITDVVLQEAKDMESEAMSRRVLSGQLLKARQGITTGGQATYGYRWETSKHWSRPRLVPDGRKADVVRLIFRMYDQGETLMTISRELGERAVPSPRGRDRWTRAVIQRLLRNRRYVGDWTWGVHPQGKRHWHGLGGLRSKERAKRHARQNPAEAWIIIPDDHEPLVSREVFERVQARLAHNLTLTAPQGAGGCFVLNRLLVCKHCGSFLNGITEKRGRGGNRAKRRVYICRGYLAYGRTYCKRNWVPEQSLLNGILRMLREAYLDPANLDKMRAEEARRQAADRSSSNLDRIRKAIADLDQKIRQGNKQLLLIPADRIPGAAEQLREWETDRDALKRELRRIKTEAPLDDLNQKIAEAKDALWRLQDAIKEKDLPLLRTVLGEMISRIELNWTHHRVGGQTRCRLNGGALLLRPTEELSQLSPWGGR
jgi:DNA invertase Pin-like site-specific DNA recombinase